MMAGGLNFAPRLCYRVSGLWRTPLVDVVYSVAQGQRMYLLLFVAVLGGQAVAQSVR